MNRKFSDVLRVLSFNGFGLILGLIISIILPIKLSVHDYSYWQIYYYYSSYIGIFMLGFSDGIHLKYAGMDYNSFDKKLFRTFFKFVLILSFIGLTVFIVIITFFVNDSDRMFALFMVGINIILFNANGFFLHVNQISGRFKFYTWGLLLDRLLFVVFIVISFISNVPNFKFYIIVNVIARLMTLIYSVRNARDLVFGDRYSFSDVSSEIIDNIRVGIFLTASSVVSMLIIGYPRILIDRMFGIKEFGMYSFANSILSIAIQVVIAGSTVLYPMLKRISPTQYENINRILNDFIIVFGSVMLAIYFPVYFFINLYLTKYIPVLEYLYLLFPIMIYQSKNNIIVSTFYKAMRLERKMLLNNIIGLLFSAIVTLFVYTHSGTVVSIVASSVVCYIIWNRFNEIYLLKAGKWTKNNRFFELLIIISFIISSQIKNVTIGFLIYTALTIIIWIFYRDIISRLIKTVKSLLAK